MIDPELRNTRATVTNTMLRQFAALWLLFFGAFALYDVLASPAPTRRALVLGLVAVGIGFPGLLKPAAIRPVFSGAMALAIPVGWLVSHVILAGLFYLLFAPIAIVFRVIGRDALKRRSEPASATYWVDRAPASDIGRYLRQS
jgi:hypothetical protein